MRSPVATIGIRGTNFRTFVTQLAANQFEQFIAVGFDPSDPNDQGISVSTEKVARFVLPGENVEVSLDGTVTPTDRSEPNLAAQQQGEQEKEQPRTAVDPVTVVTQEAIEDAFEEAEALAASEVVTVPVVPAGPTAALAGTHVFFAVSHLLGGTSVVADAGFAFDDDTADHEIFLGSLASFHDAGGTSGFSCPCDFDPNTATLVDSGSNTIGGTEVQWGAYEGDFTFSDSGGPFDEVGRFHYILANAASPGLTPVGVLAGLTGTASYSTSVGGTTASMFSDTVGSEVATSESVFIGVNFGTGTIDSYSASAAFPSGASYSASGNSTTGDFAPDSIAEFSLFGSCSGGPCGGSTFLFGFTSMGFVGSGAEGIAGALKLQGSGAEIGVKDTFLLTP